MKKILFTIALVMTMAFCANAQRDGFFGDWEYEERTMSDVGNGLAMPNTTIGSYQNSSAAPLGSGLLILTALGGCYALIRKKQK
jgi:hypothetical protein